MNLLILVVDDEPDVELLFRQQFRHDLRAGRFTMEFAPSAPAALQLIADAAGASIILILSDINRVLDNPIELAQTVGENRRTNPDGLMPIWWRRLRPNMDDPYSTVIYDLVEKDGGVEFSLTTLNVVGNNLNMPYDLI